MELLHDGVDRVPADVETAVSIGAYDGIHRGHRTVLSTLCDLARERGLAPAVVTFDEHPARVVRPENAPLLLTDNEQRMELFADVGIEWLYLLQFDQARSQTSGASFVQNTLVDRLNAKLIVVGSDFHFGKGRSGNVDTLREMGESLGFEVVGLDLFTQADAAEPISSTAIRRALAGGDIESVTAMLGRRYEVRGEVVTGDQRGRLIGFPTANLAFEPDRAWPATGVYAAWVELADGRRFGSALNIGMRPTFDQRAEHPTLEAHLLDFDEDLYGQQIAVKFVDFLRSEQRFNGIDEISAQLKKDVEAARMVLSADAD